MTLAVIRDVPRACFVLLANGERVGEFETEAAAWEFAEDQFGAQVAQSSHGGQHEKAGG
jgi:hypothetical protein